MSSLEYFRPKTVEEALALLDRGIPLAGGTVVTPQRRHIAGVIDLRELGLDGLEIERGVVNAGAALTLQSIMMSGEELPQALRDACRLEAGWNLRNMATLGGLIMAGDGRSPLLTSLMALDPHVMLEPGSKSLPLHDLLAKRREPSFRRLVTSLMFEIPASLDYAGVARAPLDRPLVCAAAKLGGEGRDQRTCIALGGFGDQPMRVFEAEQALLHNKDIDAAVEAARQAYANAGDAWASAEYRSHVAGILVGRLLKRG